MSQAPQSQRVAATYLVGERVIRMLIGFFVHTWMARSYSPEDFGFISFIVKGVSVYFAFGLFGVDEVIIKLLVGRSTEDRRDVLKTALLMRLGLGILGWIILTIVTGVASGFSSDVWLMSALFGLTIPLQALTVYELPFMANMTMKPIFYARNASYFIGVIGKVTAFLRTWERGFFIATYALEETMWKLLIFIKAAKHGFAGGKWDKAIAAALWSSGILAFLSVFVTLFDQRLAFLHLESYQEGNLLGAYSVVIALTDMVALLPISLAAALYPKVAQTKEKNPQNYPQERQRMSNWLVWSGLAFAVGTYVTAPLVLSVLYQGKYDHALSFLRGMACVSIWTFFNIGRFKWFALEEALNDWLAVALLSLGLQAIALQVFVPEHGLNGVVMALLAGQLGANLLLSFRRSVRESWLVFFKAFVPS